MKEKNLEQFKFSDELKEKLVLLVVYQNCLPKDLCTLPGIRLEIDQVISGQTDQPVKVAYAVVSAIVLRLNLTFQKA